MDDDFDALGFGDWPYHFFILSFIFMIFSRHPNPTLSLLIFKFTGIIIYIS